MNWIAFPLHPDTPPEGRSLNELFANRPINVRDMVKRLRLTATELGLPFGDRTMTYNSRLAQELAKWAATEGLEDSFHQKVFKAYFAEGLNIGDPAVLLELATAVALPANGTSRVLQERTYSSAVDRDWAQSMQLGVTAVPTFFYEGQVLVGAQPTSVLGKFLDDNDVPRRP